MFQMSKHFVFKRCCYAGYPKPAEVPPAQKAGADQVEAKHGHAGPEIQVLRGAVGLLQPIHQKLSRQPREQKQKVSTQR